MLVGRQGRIAGADLVALDDAPVVGIEERLEASQRWRTELVENVTDGAGDDPAHLLVGYRFRRRRLFCR